MVSGSLADGDILRQKSGMIQSARLLIPELPVMASKRPRDPVMSLEKTVERRPLACVAADAAVGVVSGFGWIHQH